MSTDFILVIVGFALLVGGAQSLVRGASRLALALGIPPLIVGLTIVAFGTSAPELGVSVQSALSGQSALVLGNVVGSNIYNVLFILGICATISPLAVAPRLIRLDVPVMIGCAAAVLLASLDGRIGRVDGALFLAGVALYTLFIAAQARRAQNSTAAKGEKLDQAVKPDRRYGLHLLYIGAGFALLGFGSDLLVDGSVRIAQALGVSEVVIGMTVVTLGTTAPELTTCLVASLKGQADVAVGNIVGSNIYNVLAVLGVGAVLTPGGIVVSDDVRDFGIPVMVAVCFSCLPIFFGGRTIRRWEGGLFLAYFAIYVAYLMLEALHDVRLVTLRNTVIWFVVPLTVTAIAVSVYREYRGKSSS
jgi:cation:H+ antiporter